MSKSKTEVSNCCKDQLIAVSSIEGTGHYECRACGRPCGMDVSTNDNWKKSFKELISEFQVDSGLVNIGDINLSTKEKLFGKNEVKEFIQIIESFIEAEKILSYEKGKKEQDKETIKNIKKYIIGMIDCKTGCVCSMHKTHNLREFLFEKV